MKDFETIVEKNGVGYCLTHIALNLRTSSDEELYETIRDIDKYIKTLEGRIGLLVHAKAKIRNEISERKDTELFPSSRKGARK